MKSTQMLSAFRPTALLLLLLGEAAAVLVPELSDFVVENFTVSSTESGSRVRISFSIIVPALGTFAPCTWTSPTSPFNDKSIPSVPPTKCAYAGAGFVTWSLVPIREPTTYSSQNHPPLDGDDSYGEEDVVQSRFRDSGEAKDDGVSVKGRRETGRRRASGSGNMAARQLWVDYASPYAIPPPPLYWTLWGGSFDKDGKGNEVYVGEPSFGLDSAFFPNY